MIDLVKAAAVWVLWLIALLVFIVAVAWYGGVEVRLTAQPQAGPPGRIVVIDRHDETRVIELRDLILAERERVIVTGRDGTLSVAEWSTLRVEPDQMLTVQERTTRLVTMVRDAVATAGGDFREWFLSTCRYGSHTPHRGTLLLGLRFALGGHQHPMIEPWWPTGAGHAYAKMWMRIGAQPAVWDETRLCEPMSLVTSTQALPSPQLPPTIVPIPAPE